MIPDFSKLYWAIADQRANESERVHFGHARLAGNLVVCHEDEPEPDCCDGAVTILPLESGVAISIYTDKTALDAAVKKAEIRKFTADVPNGPEVR